MINQFFGSVLQRSNKTRLLSSKCEYKINIIGWKMSAWGITVKFLKRISPLKGQVQGKRNAQEWLFKMQKWNA